MRVANVGLAAFWFVSVPLLEISIVPVTAKVEGMVKLQAAVPSPKTIFALLPDTVQAAPIVGVALFLILKVCPSVTKSGGFVPVPSVLVPQVDVKSKLPVDFE